MKKPSSDLGSGLWAVGGLAIAYLGGFLILVIFPIYDKLPSMLQKAVRFIYEPLVYILERLIS